MIISARIDYLSLRQNKMHETNKQRGRVHEEVLDDF
jgi:hypothetical protein